MPKKQVPTVPAQRARKNAVRYTTGTPEDDARFSAESKALTQRYVQNTPAITQTALLGQRTSPLPLPSSSEAEYDGAYRVGYGDAIGPVKREIMDADNSFRHYLGPQEDNNIIRDMLQPSQRPPLMDYHRAEGERQAYYDNVLQNGGLVPESPDDPIWHRNDFHSGKYFVPFVQWRDLRKQYTGEELMAAGYRILEAGHFGLDEGEHSRVPGMLPGQEQVPAQHPQTEMLRPRAKVGVKAGVTLPPVRTSTGRSVGSGKQKNPG